MNIWRKGVTIALETWPERLGRYLKLASPTEHLWNCQQLQHFDSYIIAMRWVKIWPRRKPTPVNFVSSPHPFTGHQTCNYRLMLFSCVKRLVCQVVV
ncbi:TPA: hypothetical protein N0F65_005339 [Lagenidium giganteum]|uniref:Uncharacterized protein n=1 Tax=Lagenidium giganteum TaxID=4803 RepID=A0AAV2YU59_9STRA|nr:TPA: hypothetical protein N0F65_005339 [Lagenidium giganteum]